MEMESVAYSEFEIEPRVWPLQDGTFGISAHIWRHQGAKSTITQFNAKNTYPTEEKAHHAAIELGRQPDTDLSRSPRYSERHHREEADE
jgi:hypothetical protein